MPSQSFILSLFRALLLYLREISSEGCINMVNKKSSLIISEERKYSAKPPHVLVEGGGAKLGLGYYFYLGDQQG